MALTTCKECGGKMSDRATECPHCGCPREFQEEIHPTDNYSALSQEPLSEQTQLNPKKPHKGLWISIAALVVVALCVGAFMIFGRTSTLKITPEFTKALQKYDQIDAFSEGLAAVRRDGKWGYINLKGEEVIPCQFSDVFPPGQFSEGLACVVDEHNEEDNKLWNKRVGFINKKGEFVITGDYFTEAPTLGTVWEDESHKLPSFKDGKCAVWNTAVSSLEGEGTDSGWSKEYEANKIVLVDSEGKISESTDSTAYQLANYHPYVIPTPYKGVLTPTETKVAFDDYTVNIARDTVECDNGAKLITWQIIDPIGMYGGTYEKTCQYYIDQHGNSTLTSEQETSMQQHLNGLMASLLDKHNAQLRREAEEQERLRSIGPDWLQGNWVYTLNTGDKMYVKINNGTMTVDLANGYLRHEWPYVCIGDIIDGGDKAPKFRIDSEREILMTSDGNPMSKTIFFPLPSNSDHAQSSYITSSRTTSSKEERYKKRLRELTDEHNKLLSEMRTYRSRGQLDPMNAMWYKQRMLSIKDEQIDLARQLGDDYLVHQYQTKREQLELIFRSLGMGL